MSSLVSTQKFRWLLSSIVVVTVVWGFTSPMSKSAHATQPGPVKQTPIQTTFSYQERLILVPAATDVHREIVPGEVTLDVLHHNQFVLELLKLEYHSLFQRTSLDFTSTALVDVVQDQLRQQILAQTRDLLKPPTGFHIRGLTGSQFESGAQSHVKVTPSLGNRGPQTGSVDVRYFDAHLFEPLRGFTLQALCQLVCDIQTRRAIRFQQYRSSLRFL